MKPLIIFSLYFLFIDVDFPLSGAGRMYEEGKKTLEEKD
jgi:hypothetical protein